ncbi:phage holin family protein [Chitiniphilus shinanonensis]|uniref:phage holin family protein n=1 Tax=Chitiniphilus shinanonensis TaxID=553088 RepID=UPI0003AAEDAA|nr:phage holin family protein [Chitiniphilus shinanonensis]
MTEQQDTFRPFHRLAASLIGLLHAHLGIFAIELEEARERVLRTLVLGFVGAGLLVMCLVALASALVLALPPEWRVGVLAGAGVVFLLLGIGLVWAAWNGFARGPTPFAVTMEELRRDRERLLS